MHGRSRPRQRSGCGTGPVGDSQLLTVCALTYTSDIRLAFTAKLGQRTAGQSRITRLGARRSMDEWLLSTWRVRARVPPAVWCAASSTQSGALVASWRRSAHPAALTGASGVSCGCAVVGWFRRELGFRRYVRRAVFVGSPSRAGCGTCASVRRSPVGQAAKQRGADSRAIVLTGLRLPGRGDGRVMPRCRP